MSHSPNGGGSKQGPKVTKQGKTGPITGNTRGPGSGKAGPWSMRDGSNKGMNFGKNVKKS